MHAECGGGVGDSHCLTRVLERVAEERQDARWDDRRDGFQHVSSSTVLLRRRDDGPQRDSDIIDPAKNEIIHTRARERENLARGIRRERAVRDDGNAWKTLTNGPDHSERWRAGAIAKVDDRNPDEPFRHEREQLVLLIARSNSCVTAERFLNPRACGLLAHQNRDDHRKYF